MNFVTIAVETAEFPCHAIYSIGLVKYQDGKKIDIFYSLVKPPELCVQPNVAITHERLSVTNNRYTAEDLQNAPTIAELWLSKIHSFIGNFCLVSRRMGYDIDILLANLEWFGLPSPALSYFCFFQLGWNLWPSIKQHSHLPSFAEELGVEHKINNTLDEAEVYGKIILMAAEKLKSSNIDDLLRAAKLQIEMIVKSSLNLWENNLEKPLEDYDILELEHLAVVLYKRCLGNKNYQKKRFADIINDILWERGKRLDENHVWTEENVNKLLKANELLVLAAKKGHNYAQSIVEKLGIERIDGDKNGRLVNDAEIKLTPYIGGYEDLEDSDLYCFTHVLCEPINNNYLLMFYANDTTYFEVSENYNYYFSDENRETLDCFKDKYISYAIHELLEAHWFDHDIMNINRVHIEVKVESGVSSELYKEEYYGV